MTPHSGAVWAGETGPIFGEMSCVPFSAYPRGAFSCAERSGYIGGMERSLHRILTHLLNRERHGITSLRVMTMELEGYDGQITELIAQGLLEYVAPNIGLTEVGRQIAEGLPEKWTATAPEPTPPPEKLS